MAFKFCPIDIKHQTLSFKLKKNALSLQDRAFFFSYRRTFTRSSMGTFTMGFGGSVGWPKGI